MWGAGSSRPRQLSGFKLHAQANFNAHVIAIAAARLVLEFLRWRKI
jgi:hypothetical protein